MLIEDLHKEVGDVKSESARIREKVMGAKLNPNERKKITSKKLGKWLSMSDDNCIIGIVCVQEDYPERLAYKMINECSQKLIEAFGEDAYQDQDSGSVKGKFGTEFKQLIKKYNNPASFDKLTSAQAKVDLAKDKMAANCSKPCKTVPPWRA